MSNVTYVTEWMNKQTKPNQTKPEKCQGILNTGRRVRIRIE